TSPECRRAVRSPPGPTAPRPTARDDTRQSADRQEAVASGLSGSADGEKLVRTRGLSGEELVGATDVLSHETVADVVERGEPRHAEVVAGALEGVVADTEQALQVAERDPGGLAELGRSARAGDGRPELGHSALRPVE